MAVTEDQRIERARLGLLRQSFPGPRPARIRYQDRVIAFLDILGWSSWMAASTSDRAALKAVGALAFELADSATRKQNPKTRRWSFVRTSHFSDSVIVSCPYAAGFGTFPVLAKVFGLARVAMRHGMLIRGGIARGPLFHYDNVAFGPALVEAYAIESRIAIYPRVDGSSDPTRSARRDLTPASARTTRRRVLTSTWRRS